MAFSTSCCSIRLVREAILTAERAQLDGSYIESRLDLDRCLGNENGSFDIGGNEFVGSAQRIRLKGTKLTAKLQAISGVYEKATVDLDYFVANATGQLRPIRPGSGCFVCRDFFEFNESLCLSDLRGDDRQTGCLRCAALESSIMEYNPTIPATDDDWQEHFYVTFSDGSSVSLRYQLLATGGPNAFDQSGGQIGREQDRAPHARRQTFKDGKVAWLALRRKDDLKVTDDGVPLFTRIGRLNNTATMDIPGTEGTTMVTFRFA
ncbi:hypothetical protein B0A55_00192 [Friedmanniomyces simplex]|uniref:Cyanovirin-N domain-containing protein n=1 Tax=Friedmanniomyces simplex TaxID=329884 RepID=A0A4U0Y184_9PEZI|nr:hypothetical protein B0A55_00192 [Friedmanniomyces simplex]